jgi:hypothetical protein
MGMADYIPVGGGATTYLLRATTLDSYSSVTNAYTTLAPSPVSMPSYGSLAWYASALWVYASGDLLKYTISGGAWTVATTGLTTSSLGQTAADDAGNIWGFQSEGVLLQYNIASTTVTTHALQAALPGFEPRIVWDSCAGLFYLADYANTPFYSYNPTTGAQTTLSGLPGSIAFQDGLCGDRSGHIFAVTNTATTYQYTIASGTWTPMPAGGVTGSSNSACSVGADGFLYVTDPARSATMYRIQLQ